MKRENRCQHCGGYLVKYRNPKQRYCSKAACQRQRKNLWRRNKLSTDSDYRSNQNAANRKWGLTIIRTESYFKRASSLSSGY